MPLQFSEVLQYLSPLLAVDCDFNLSAVGFFTYPNITTEIFLDKSLISQRLSKGELDVKDKEPWARNRKMQICLK